MKLIDNDMLIIFSHYYYWPISFAGGMPLATGSSINVATHATSSFIDVATHATISFIDVGQGGLVDWSRRWPALVSCVRPWGFRCFGHMSLDAFPKTRSTAPTDKVV